MDSRSQNNKNPKVAVVTLGCARNLVDSQKISGSMLNKGYDLTEVDDADVVILNTCAFIEDAKQESIDAILDLIELKKQKKIAKIVIAGCLAQRYSEELVHEFPEIDAIVGALQLEKESQPDQVSLTPGHYAYLKICESCYNNCSFCVIPSIKGKFVSRSIDSILQEVTRMDQRGVKELNVIGQDITAYGMDLYKEKSLARLLKEICAQTKKIEWIRLLYTFPSHITDELIDVIAREDKICKYIDVPFQHISDKILQRMNRKISKQETYDLIAKIRQRIPGCYLRTALIVGLPGETDEDFDELLRFVQDVRLEKLGVFMYSHEGGVPAYDMPDQVSQEVKEDRHRILMEAQQKISEAVQSGFLDKKVRVLIDQRHETEGDVFIGRTAFDAPDVDGVVYVHVPQDANINVGDFVDVQITHTAEYDLIGDLV